MKYTRLGKTGLEVSRICLGCMSFGDPKRGNHAWSLPKPTSRPIIRKACEAGINFFDTANVYSHGTQRGDHRQGAEGARAARASWCSPPRCTARMREGPNGQGLVAQGDPAARSTTPEAPRHRLCRPLPDPPLGLQNADRGDARGAQRRRARRQGPLYRRLLDVSPGSSAKALAISRAARLGEVRLHAESRQPALPRGRARDAAAVRAPRASA